MQYLIEALTKIIEAMVCFCFYNSIIKQSKYTKRTSIIVLLISFLLVGVLTVVFGDTVNAICLLIINLVASLAFTNYSFVKSVAISFTTSFLMLIPYVLFDKLFVINPDEALKFICVRMLCELIVVPLLIMVSYIVNKIEKINDIKLNIMMFPLMILISFALGIIFFRQFNVVALIAMLIAVSIIMILFYQQKNIEKEKELSQLKLIQQEENFNKTYFDLLEHQNEELQIFVHDTEKHLNNIYDLANDVEVKNYISSLITRIEDANKFGKTSNKLLDLIIEKYDYLCEKNGISFAKNIHYSKLDFINDNDLTSILNNLLDNAIEATQFCDSKIISLSINRLNNMTVIEVCNTCENQPKTKHGKLVSTKDDSNIHGYGFKSVEKSVNRYSGDIDWEYDKDSKKFMVSIIF